MMQLSHYPAALGEALAEGIAQAAQRANEIDSQLMAVDTQIRLTVDKANAIAHLEYLRNQFSVAKLEARLA